VDKEKTVRDQAFRAVAMFVQILEEHAAKMPDTTLAGDGTLNLGLGTSNGGADATLVSSAAGAAGALAGWAISSIGRKFAPTDMQAGITPAETLPPPVPSETKPTFNSRSSAPPVPSGSKPRSMQLGGHKNSVPGSLPGGLAEETRWGGDLMDVNDDADDWNEFESSPAESAGPNAVGMGWGGTGDDEDPWGALDEPAPPPVPIPVTELTSPPEPVRTSASATAPSRTRPADAARPSRIRALSPSASQRITPLGSPMPSERGTSPVPVASPATVTGTTAGMTKEEKAAEMVRRKEERKQRIAQLKEQKKNAAGAKG